MKKNKVFKVICVVSATILIAGIIAVGVILEPAININGFVSLDEKKLAFNTSPVAVYDANNTILDEGFVAGKIYTPIEKVQKHTIDAFVAIEDKRFFEHLGLDYYRIFGASVKNVRNGSFSEGASTITQQLVKNTHLSSEKNMKRKVMEMRIATDVERHYSKHKILEMYLNVIYFGNNIYGIGRACNAYFGKSVEDLSVNESAMLAGIINNPSVYNPILHSDKANARRVEVLKRMRDQSKIRENEYKLFVGEDILVKRVSVEQYANFSIEEARVALGGENSSVNLSGYKIYTYLDSDLEEKINNLVREYKFDGSDNAIIHAIVMNTEGEVLANCSNVNSSLTKNYRQPGSIIKPAFSFASAFEKKIISPKSLVLDEPTNFNGYRPENYKNKNLGWISVSDALKYSQNVPAVKLSEECGLEYCKSVAKKLGYEFDANDKNYAIALGGMSKGALLTQMANSFQAFANGGRFIKCSHIKKIVADNGQTIYMNPRESVSAVSEETAYFINSILRECTFDGTARRIGKAGSTLGMVAGKTGTVGNENGNSDAFVVAYSRDYVVAVWIGAKKGLLGNGVTGGTHPAIIAQEILEYLPINRGFDVPASIVNIDIDKNEYKNNHKIVIASPKNPQKDKIVGEFNRFNVPKDRKKHDNYMLDTEYVDLDGFVFVN